MKRVRSSPVLALALLLLCGLPGWSADASSTPSEPAPAEAPTLSAGDTAWMLTSTALVMLMVPGLALFYGGLTRRKNILGTMMHSMVALSIIGIQWVAFGYCLAFGASQGGYYGWSPELLFLGGVKPDALFPGTGIPIYVHCMYQGMFAIITPALISGAIAERIRFAPYCLFILLWAILVYDPLAHWVWAVSAEGKAVGWLGAMGALDFAGGTVVHIAAGASGLAAILLLRKRLGYPEHAMHPNSMVLCLLGAGLLWFGWFGFNGGSAVGSNALAGSALTATQVAAAAAGLAWLAIEWIHRGKPTALGLATGAVAGLVAVTPAAGFVFPSGAMAIGLIAGVVCYLSVMAKAALKYDDSLDAFGVHGIGGLLGALLTGLFCSKLINSNGADAGLEQLKIQAIAAAAAIVYSFVLTVVLVKAIDLTMGFCLTPQEENEGLDRTQHGEVGFDFGLAIEQVAVEPRAASRPKNGVSRYTLVVEGPRPPELHAVWSDFCQANGGPTPPDFLQVYPNLTTVQGNRFRFRGGDPATTSIALERLLNSKLRGVKVRAE